MKSLQIDRRRPDLGSAVPKNDSPAFEKLTSPLRTLKCLRRLGQRLLALNRGQSCGVFSRCAIASTGVGPLTPQRIHY